jgi:hypothetical protein
MAFTLGLKTHQKWYDAIIKNIRYAIRNISAAHSEDPSEVNVLLNGSFTEDREHDFPDTTMKQV